MEISPSGVKRTVSPELQGGVRNLRQMVADFLAAMRRIKGEGVEEDVASDVTQAVKEGWFDPKTMTWQDDKGGKHTQKCNIRGVVEGTRKADQPDVY